MQIAQLQVKYTAHSFLCQRTEGDDFVDAVEELWTEKAAQVGGKIRVGGLLR